MCDSQQQKQFIASSIRLSVDCRIHETCLLQGLGHLHGLRCKADSHGHCSRPCGKGQKGVKLRESAHEACRAGPARRPRRGRGATGGPGGAAGRGGAESRGLARALPQPLPAWTAAGRPGSAAGGAAHPGAELLAFERFLDLEPAASSTGTAGAPAWSSGRAGVHARQVRRPAGELVRASGDTRFLEPTWGGELLLPCGSGVTHWRRILNRKTWRNVSTRPPCGRGSLGSYLQPQGLLLLLRLPVLWYRHGPCHLSLLLREQDCGFLWPLLALETPGSGVVQLELGLHKNVRQL